MWTYEDEIRFERMIAHQKGRELGESIGEKRGEKNGTIKTVKKMIEENLSIDLITKITGLSKKEIKKYQRN